jgi:threonine aldolase
MAKLLEARVRRILGVKIIQKIEVNGFFAQIPRRAIVPLRRKYFFYTWDEAASVVRWMCSWDTTEKDVQEFARVVAQTVR